MQTWRMVHRQRPGRTDRGDGAVYGSSGGFTTFVANAAGPILNTYLVRLGLGKDELVGTSAWFYFAVNVAKVPGVPGLRCTGRAAGRSSPAPAWPSTLSLIPAVLVGVFSGRRLLHKLPEQAFLIGVLVLSAAGAVKMLLP